MLTWSDTIPSNIRFFPDAERDFLKLDKGSQIKVAKAVLKISRAPREIGKPLENQAGRALAGFRTVYVDDRRLRVVWRVLDSGTIEIAVVAAIAVRDGLEAYNLTTKRRPELERFIDKVTRELS